MMKKTLHEEFAERERNPIPSEIHLRHPSSAEIIHRCKEIIYALPSARHLIDMMNVRQIPVWVEIAETSSSRVEGNICVILSCHEAYPLYTALSLHLVAALREIEFHLPDYRPPEMKDSLTWLHPHMKEPFEIMLAICRAAYDLQFEEQKEEVEEFLRAHNMAEIYHAYEHKQPREKLEALMLYNFNDRR